MNQVPTQIWNEIAATQPLKTEAARLAFALNERQMEQLMEEWGKELPSKISLGLQLVLPLLTEREAIRSYLSADPERLGLAQALPEVNSPQEAAQLAARELSMSPEQTRQLTMLLQSDRPLTAWLASVKALSTSASLASA
jgi:hypothetical protein